MTLDGLNKYQPYALAALRVVTALTFAAHGTQKMFGFPASQMGGGGGFELFSLMGLAGVLEVFGGLAILLGLFTRPVAFVLSGMMAYAFWFVHVPMMGQGNIIPVANGGDGAVLFCFVFLYLVFAGPGAFSVDAMLKGRSRAAAAA
jgi:putative oxidoreductase